ncbi:MAG: PaaI family thioesterase [Acidobacteriota bacterium]|nr:PaaI family thioesterase [Blastocatellia bacterium]MDW8240797.1 PaaI family thioesterase [Acidobacteriota bacterium]
MKRERTITWADPQAVAATARQMSGLEYLQAIQRQQLPAPPIASLMGYDLVEVSPGRVVFVVSPHECHYNPLGVVHGGLLATVMDSAMACAIHTMLPRGEGSTTLELHVNYVRAVTIQTGPLRCEGEVIYRGGRIATAQARVFDQSGLLYAHGTTTCLIFRLSQDSGTPNQQANS